MRPAWIAEGISVSCRKCPTFLAISRSTLRRWSCSGGAIVPVQPKALAVLVYLVRSRDRVVSQKELLDAVWSGVNVSPNSLARPLDRYAGNCTTLARRSFVPSTHVATGSLPPWSSGTTFPRRAMRSMPPS